jgi:hypothetical protein
MSSSDEQKSKFKALIWIPKHGIVAQSILNEAHDAVGHQGQNTSLAFTRSCFWITSPSYVYKSIKQNCPHYKFMNKLMFRISDQEALTSSRRSKNLPYPWQTMQQDKTSNDGLSFTIT